MYFEEIFGIRQKQMKKKMKIFVRKMDFYRKDGNFIGKWLLSEKWNF